MTDDGARFRMEEMKRALGSMGSVSTGNVKRKIRMSDAQLMRTDGGLPFCKADIRKLASRGDLTREQIADALGVSREHLDWILDSKE